MMVRIRSFIRAHSGFFVLIGAVVVLASAGVIIGSRSVPAAECDLVTAFRKLTKNAEWKQVAVIPVGFDTHHPQGFAKVGDYLFLSSVEILEHTRKYDPVRGGLDRTAGQGKGHLFKMDLDGNLLDQIELGQGAIYHPGGIDFDGRYVWVPVAEYRPHSISLIYRVDPASMEATEVFRYADHIGSLVHNTDEGTLHGVSWGSRRLYTWRLDDGPTVTDVPPEQLYRVNPAHYIDYQDCQYVGAGRALCFGLGEYRQRAGASPFVLGGMELLDMRQGQPLHQVPVSLWTEEGLSLTRNPVELETTEDGLRAYFMPEDNESRLFIYDVSICP